jgi:hypothetical protein
MGKVELATRVQKHLASRLNRFSEIVNLKFYNM